jgi:hypothetical protein
MNETADNLTKVCIDLPNHWWLKGESFWAKPLGAEVERANATFVALNVPPSVDIDALLDHLDEQEALGVLHFETCEERVPGSFDDRPDESGGGG